MFSEAYWNDRYNTAPALWSGNPNQHLVAETRDLPPGTALDVACGEGADAIWLSDQGWQVTAIDISTVALDRAAQRERARRPGNKKITWQQADLLTWQPTSTYDLITVQYVHLPPDLRDQVFTKLRTAVAENGTLLVAAHHVTDLDTTMARPQHMRDFFYTGDDIAKLLDPADWRIVTDKAAPRQAKDPDGHEVTIHDTVFRARRSS